ncbi:MAG: exodeoxyribonuclease V subunit gamma [Spirochaetes bacterium]|nr:exodeoxyribonuclease V subunit gamma [Spirochaetota bacterium]
MLNYFHATRLSDLFPLLREKVHTERRRLTPQKPQTIVVGNLDTEAWLERQFIELDTILMGVTFPFLESAIGNFIERIFANDAPLANANWFSNRQSPVIEKISLGDLAAIIYGIVCAEENAASVKALGYDIAAMHESTRLLVAHRLATALREYALHIPDELGAHEAATTQNFWRLVREKLGSSKRTWYTFDTQLPYQLLDKTSAPGTSEPDLFLFGMPLLSLQHTRLLAVIARKVTVNIFTVDLSHLADNTDTNIAALGKKHHDFHDVLAQSAKFASVPLHIQNVASTEPQANTQVYFCAFPGVQRMAELSGDMNHALLMQDATLRQDDIAVALTDGASQFSAFDIACGARSLYAYTRANFIEAGDAAVEFWKIVSNAATMGLSRPLITSYITNPIVRAIFAIDDEGSDMILSIFSRAHAFRDDYPESQAAYNFDHGLERIQRALLQSNDAPLASVELRFLDAPNFVEKLLTLLQPLVGARSTLSTATGGKVSEALRKFAEFAIGNDEAPLAATLEWSEHLLRLPGSQYIGFTALVKLMEKYFMPSSIKQTFPYEGITFSAFTATCFTKKIHWLADLNEIADKKSDVGEELIAAYRTAQTRLTATEQLATTLVTALYSGAERLYLAWSNRDNKTAAERYPSQLIESIRRHAAELRLPATDSHNYPPTILSKEDESSAPPIASDADARTRFLVQNDAGKSEAQLTKLLLPHFSDVEIPGAIAWRDLETFLLHPTLQKLAPYFPELTGVVAFRSDEPQLGVADSGRLRFCENYLKEALLSAQRAPAPEIETFIRRAQERGEHPPAGFDQALSLVRMNQNSEHLKSAYAQFSDDTCVQEIYFNEHIEMRTVYDDGERLKRYYFPAPQIGGHKIAGLAGQFILDTTTQRLHKLEFYWGNNRTVNLVQMHLLLCALSLCAGNDITALHLTTLAFETKKDNNELRPALKEMVRMNIPDKAAAETYLQNIVESFATNQFVWFDANLLGPNNLEGMKDLSTENIIDRIDTPTPVEIQLSLARQIYDLRADANSVAYFDKFIRPVAAHLSDKSEEPTTPVKKRSKSATANKKKL